MFKLGIDLGTPALDLPALGHLLNVKSVPPAECTDGDVRTVLGAFGLDDLRRLDGAFQKGLVVRRVFHAGGGRGCLLYHLNNAIVSFGAQSQYFAKDTEAFRASQTLIAAWDSNTLSEERVRNLVAELIRARQPQRSVRDPWDARLAAIEMPASRHMPERAANGGPTRDKRGPAESTKADNRFHRAASGRPTPVALL
jgi:hypothetical protein